MLTSAVDRANRNPYCSSLKRFFSGNGFLKVKAFDKSRDLCFNDNITEIVLSKTWDEMVFV